MSTAASRRGLIGSHLRISILNILSNSSDASDSILISANIDVYSCTLFRMWGNQHKSVDHPADLSESLKNYIHSLERRRRKYRGKYSRCRSFDSFDFRTRFNNVGFGHAIFLFMTYSVLESVLKKSVLFYCIPTLEPGVK